MKNVWFKYIILVIFFLSFSCISAQELTKDQLIQLPFDSIEKIEFDSRYGGDYGLKVLNAHITKARYLNDTVQLVTAYRRRAWELSFDDAIKSIDSGIQIINNKRDKYKQSLSLANYTKGAIFYENGHPEEAVEEFIVSFHNADKVDIEHKIDCINAIAALKREYGQQEEAIILQKESLKLLKKYPKQINNYDLTYLITLDNISRCFLEIKQIDSCRFYSNKGLSLALQMNDNETFEGLTVLKAQANYYDSNFFKARDTLLKYVDNFEGASKADVLFYLGMIEGKLGDSKKKEEWFYELDNVLRNENFPLIDNVKGVYQFLLKNAMTRENDSLQKSYLDRLIYYDSLAIKTRNYIASTTLIHFDIPNQESTQRNFENQIKSKSKTLKWGYTLVIFLGIMCTLILVKYFRAKRKFKQIMEADIKITPNTNEKVNLIDLGIDEEIINDILKNLEKWEVELGYLSTTMNQNTLAKMIKTNSTYLSKVVNTYKGVSFSNYLKDLRITYAINYLKSTPEILNKKSTIQLSEMFGFNSIDVFVSAFKKKTEMTPSSFFRQLKKGNL